VGDGPWAIHSVVVRDEGDSLGAGIMSVQAVFLPLFAEVTLTFILLFWMAYLRSAALVSGEVDERDISLGEQNWPWRATLVANAFHNQLELPPLFYLLTILAWATRLADMPFVLMAWVFVALRLLHALIHVTTNNTRYRGVTFIGGAVVLAVMWEIFILRIMLSLR
jgi:hypothetical protein